MLITGIKRIIKSGLVASAITGAVFFASVENTYAASAFNFNYLFSSVEPGRVGYMDAAGTWNGSSVVTDITGDDFTFNFQNSGPGIAYNVDLSLNVPNGFRVPANLLAANVNLNSSVGAGCNDINNVAITQAGAGQPVLFNIPSGRSIPVGCSYTFDLGMTTNGAGVYTGNFSVSIDYTENSGPVSVANPLLTVTSSIQAAVPVRQGVITLSKTTSAISAVNGDQITYNIAVTADNTPVNTNGALFGVNILDLVGPGLTLVSIAEASLPTFGSPFGGNGYRFAYLAVGQTVNLTVIADVVVDPISSPCPSLTNTASGFHDLFVNSDTDFATVNFDTTNALTLTYNPNSFCELCGTGTVNLLVENTGVLTLDTVVVTVNLNNPGLTVVPGTTRFAIDGGAAGAPGSQPDPTPLGGGQFQWDLGRIDSTLAALSPQRIEVIFDVVRDTSGAADEEGLIDAVVNRDITATSTFEFLCDASNTTENASTGPVELFLEQPLPQIDKLGRNPDAGQTLGNFGDTVFGHKDDNIIWRVEVANTGLADLQNLLLDDIITAGNFDIQYICNSDANAQVAADLADDNSPLPVTVPAPAPPAGCISATDTPSGPPLAAPVEDISIFDFDDPFGVIDPFVPGTLDIDVAEGTSGFVFLVGTILSACTNEINASTVEFWGCEVDDPNGGNLDTPGPNGGVTPGVTLSDTANLSAEINAGLTVTHDLTGIDGVQDVGSKGLLTITIDNQTNTTVRNIHLRDILPAEYVVDPTVPNSVDINDAFPEFSITVTPSYGVNYPGMIDTITWDAATRDNDSEIGNITANMLTNTTPEFTLTSSLTNADYPVHNHMLRHGDSITITLRVILIDRPHFDIVADLDIVPELDTSSSTDPVTTFQVRNQLEVTYEDICVGPDPVDINLDNLFTATPEDLDVNVSDLLYILTNDITAPVTLSVELTNNGGHDADDYELFVSFGEAMVVAVDGSGDPTPANGCVATTNPPPTPVWDVPEPIPASATVFLCNRGVISPLSSGGATEVFDFSVTKNPTIPTNLFDDDLTFRADVVGQITLSDGTPLIHPTVATTTTTLPTAPTAQIDNTSNNYTLDGIRSRVLGFNLTKVLNGDCTEDNPPPLANENVVIGEDCTYRIEAGGWFGFQTPGFNLIAVQDVTVRDEMPDGQGFISTDDGANFSDLGATGIRNIARVPVVPALTQMGPLINNGAGVGFGQGWTFNDAANPIEEKDKFFRVDLTTRILNDPIDPFYPFDPVQIPNLHGALSTDVGVAEFTAVFDTQTFTVDENSGVPGYPAAPDRTIDLTITEPNLITTKTVCNETLSIENGNGSGPNCVPFQDLVTLGDTNDSYIYRIRVYNEFENNGVAAAAVQRSKAHEVIITDTIGTDIQDKVSIIPFDADGLDNDGDGLTDAVGGDLDEGQISDNILENGAAPILTFSHTNSSALVTINPDLPANAIDLYYRVDLADTVAPLQRINSQLNVSYDSLPGDSGSQNIPQELNGHDIDGAGPLNYGGSARVYDAIEQTADIQVVDVVLLPKEIIDVSHSGLTTLPTTQNVVVGEEVQYRLISSLPVAKLRSFVIEDELPPGIRCVDDNVADGIVQYPKVDLDSARYSGAGFQPGGTFRPICTQAPANSGLPDTIVWDFGDQEITLGAPGQRYDFEIDFTVRIENSLTTIDGNTILNGDEANGGTKVETRYIDEVGNPQVVEFLGVEVVIHEPSVTVTKLFDPVVNADGLDVLLVTVTATNANTATTSTAYNLQILDDLRNTKYNYIPGSESSAVPAQIPDNVDLSLGPNQPIFNWDNLASEGYALAPGESISFTYEVQVDHTITPLVQQRLVAPHEQLLNTIEARWTSLPDTSSSFAGGATPAGNFDVTTDPTTSLPTGFISADGEFLGMRNGQLTGLALQSTNPPNDYNATANDFVDVIPLTIDKEDLTPTPPFEAAIGARKMFSITIDIPEGITNGIKIRDNLAAAVGGLSYVLENDPGPTPAFDIEYSFPGIVEINGTNITGFAPTTAPEVYEALFTGAATIPADESTGPIEWDIGTVITDAENDAATNAINPQIVITYFARIDNIAAIVDDSRLQNAAELEYINGQNGGTETVTDNTAETIVVESDLAVTKIVSNITSPGIAPDAGDILEYELTIPNSGNATAYDINIVDTLPTGTLLDTSFNPVATITVGGIPNVVATFNQAPLGSPGATLTWGRGNTSVQGGGDRSLVVPASEQLVLTYRVIVQNTVEPGLTLTNNVNVDWTSLSGDDPLERTGAGCPTTTAPNIYCESDTFDIQVIDNNSLDKTRTDDSFVTGDANVRVGDTLEYTLTMTMQEGTTDNIVITDTLPAGLKFNGILSINGVGAAPFINVSPFQHGNYTQATASLAGDETIGTTVTFDLGTIVNEGVADLNDPGNNNFVIIYQAQVVNDVLAIPQLASTNLQNDAQLNYDDYAGAATLADPRLLDSEIITVQQPIIFTADISKTATVPSGSRVASGALMDFALTACNVGDAPAYDVLLEDIFPNELDIGTIRAPGDIITAGTLPEVTYELAAAPGVAVGAPLAEGAANDFIYVAPVAAGRTMQISLHNEARPLLPAHCVVVRYDINVIALGANLSWDNTFQVFEYYSLDAQDANVLERQRYGLAGPVLFNMNSITPNNPPEKYLTAPLDYEATIGELVTYRIVVPSDDDDPGTNPNPNPMQVVLYDVEIRDTMSTHLEFVSATLDTSVLGVFGTQPFGALPGETLDATSSVGNQVNVDIASIPVESGYTRQAFIDVTARVVNVDTTFSASPTRTFNNTVSYTFSAAPGGGAISPSVGSAVTDPLDDVSIVEPAVTLDSKVVSKTKVGDPDAGDILTYTLTLSAATGGVPDIYSDAYDITVIDTLGAGLAYSGNATVTNSGPYTNTIGAPSTVGDGSVASPQTMTWNLANSNIDIQEGDTITITYDVVVVNAALANQALDNSALIQWTSNDGVVVGERDGTINSPATRRYISGPLSANTLVTTDTNDFDLTTGKVKQDDTYGGADANVRIGDLVDYVLTMNVQEGTSQNLTLVDTLPVGLKFEGIVSINGQNDDGNNQFDPDLTKPFIYPGGFYTQAIASIVSANTDPRAGPTDVQFALGDLINDGKPGTDVEDGNDDFVIVYRARVIDLVAAQLPNLSNPVSPLPLANNIVFDYDISSGISGDFTASPAATQSSNENITIRQPNLNITSKLVATAGGDNIIEANEVITYTVSIENTGELEAYDVVVQDIIPVGLRAGAVPGNLNVLSVTLASATPFTSVPVVYDPLTGIATWDFDSNAANQVIPVGDTLVIVYEVAADATIGAGLMNIVNTAQVLRYHSFDNDNPPTPAFVPASLAGAVPVREIYGPSAIVQSPPLQTETPDPLLKETPVVTEVTIGEPFVYTITVPETDTNTALYDVRILDNLLDISTAQNVDLIFVGVNKVSADGTWVPINTNNPFEIVIEDVVDGIDIPVTAAADQAVIELTLMLTDSPNNQAGDTFTNSAYYTFNQFDGGDATTEGTGGTGTSGVMTIVEPELTLQKLGPATPVTYGNAIPYTLTIENIGDSPAYDITVSDFLPNTADNDPPYKASTCPISPAAVSPGNYIAQLYENDGVTTAGAPLVLGTDYTVTHTAPSCEIRITTLTAAIPPTQKLIISYDAYLDIDSVDGALLTNTAGITQYFSQDTANNIATNNVRDYNYVIDIADGIQQHESQYTVTVLAPVLVIQKTVENLTSGQIPAPNTVLAADPIDELRYTITIQNINPNIDVPVLSLLDDPDLLSPAPGLFRAGSLKDIVVSAPVLDASDPNGGTFGTGILDLQNLSLTAAGGAQDTITISFTMEVAAVVVSGSMIQNQAFVSIPGFNPLGSDDPNINGADNPIILGDEDTTDTLLDAVPTFEVEKTSADLTDDPNILRAGDTLRYTITVKNIGVENSVNTLLRDQIPANTTYITSSTTLNGVAIADGVGGVTPLQDGLLINAPENITAGYMRADMDDAADNKATITFDVVIDAGVVDSAVISNQAFVAGNGEGSGPFAEQPSDDPGTELLNDPTQDVIGNFPIIDAQKTVSIAVDGGVQGVVEINDVLEYEITVSNAGIAAATSVSLFDAIPTNTTYVPGSVEFYDPVTDTTTSVADGTLVSLNPLTIRLNSSDLAVHNQAADDGQINPGFSSVVRFQVTVVAAVGNQVSNQATIISAELPDEQTDADGNDENGDQPTVIGIGVNSDLTVTKEVFVVGGGLAQAGGELEYVIQVENVGNSNATNIVLTDVIPVGTSYVAGSVRLNGSASFNGGAVVELPGSLQANYQTAKGALEEQEKFTFSFRVLIDAGLITGTTITNTVDVDSTELAAPIFDSASIDVGGAPGVGVLRGHVWHEIDRETPVTYTPLTDPDLQDWVVNVYLNNNLFASTVTDASGLYNFIGLPPGSPVGADYRIQFIPPGGSDTSASMGRTIVDALHGAASGSVGEMNITGITVNAGVNIAEQNLPVIPHGVIYDAVLRTPVAGANISLVQVNGNPVPANCLPANSNQASQQTLATGFYRFDIQAGSCGITNFVIQIDGLPISYLPGTSQIIPPGKAGNTLIDVPTCSESAEDMILGNGDCDIQFSEQQPDTSVPVRTDSTRTGSQGTTYYLEMRANADGDVPFNNHIPLDPELSSAIAISKVSSMVNVTRGQLVPYTITMRNTLAAPIFDLNLEDLYPLGFKYIAGSGRIQIGNGPFVKTEPVLDTASKMLVWPNLSVLGPNSTVTVKMLLVVGSGVGEGEYVNRAQVRNTLTSTLASGQASATVRVVPDPTFDCSDVIGKVFDDKNLNAYQDEGEAGLAGARVVTARGLEVTADEHGRFHITCAVVPNADRGSNFIIKLDERSLPTGYRLTTENPRVLRATRGKMLKFNFGAAIHRVIRLDMANEVFEPGTTQMRPQWLPRLDLLMTELAKDPSLLRLSYLADNETESEVNDRLEAVKEEIQNRWEELNCCYQLMIETEVFWRKGGPVDRGAFDD